VVDFLRNYAAVLPVFVARQKTIALHPRRNPLILNIF